MKYHTALQALLALAATTAAVQSNPDAPELAVREITSPSSACTDDRADCDSPYPTSDTARNPPSTTHTSGVRHPPTSQGGYYPNTPNHVPTPYPSDTGATPATPGPTAPAGPAGVGGGSGGAAMLKESGTSSASASGSGSADAALSSGGVAARDTAGVAMALGAIVGVMAL